MGQFRFGSGVPGAKSYRWYADSCWFGRDLGLSQPVDRCFLAASLASDMLACVGCELLYYWSIPSVGGIVAQHSMTSLKRVTYGFSRNRVFIHVQVLCFSTFYGRLQAFYQLDNRRSEAPVGLQFADLLEQMITLAEDRLETGWSKVRK